MKKSIFILTFLLVASLASIIFLSSNRLTYQSKAAPSCHPLCQTEPSCCAEILRRLEEVGDDIYDLPDAEQPYHACEWDAGNADTNYRGYCKPSTCNQLPEGIKYRGHCGWYWGYHEGYTNSANGYGCMIGASEGTMRPICDGGKNPTNTPAPNATQNPTQPPQGKGGKVKISVHKESLTGALWNESKTVSVYIEGPSSGGHRFGELLKVYGLAQSSCTSRGGFPYVCEAGSATWNGADGNSGTAVGSYTATIMEVPSGWKIKDGTKSGNLSSGATLNLDVSVSKTSKQPTSTPPPGATATPTDSPNPTVTLTPTPTTSQNRNQNQNNESTSLRQRVRAFFGLTTPQPTSQQSNPQQQPQPTQQPSAVSNVVENTRQSARGVLDTFGALFQQVVYLDGVLENTIDDLIF